MEEEGADMKRWRRVRLFIAKKFQIRYITLILLFMFATVILTGYTVYVTTWIMLGEKLAAVYPQGLLLEVVKKVNLVLLFRLALVTPVVVFICLVLSNRIAGPIYHIQRYLKRISAGKYDINLKLRKHDELQDVAGAVNNLVSKLRSERNQRRKRIDHLTEKAGQIEKAFRAGAPDKEEIVAEVTALRRELEELKKG